MIVEEYINVNIPIRFKFRINNWDKEILSSIPSEYKKALYLNLENKVVLDIGAHIGGFSKLISVMNPKAIIHAYEPDIDSFSLLKDNLGNNANCILHNVGVSGKELSGKLWRKKVNTDPAMYEVIWTDKVPESETETIPCLPINNILNQFHEIGLMKIDCEGSELSFLPCITKDNINKIHGIVGEIHTSEKALHNCNLTQNNAGLIKGFFYQS